MDKTMYDKYMHDPITNKFALIKNKITVAELFKVPTEKFILPNEYIF